MKKLFLLLTLYCFTSVSLTGQMNINGVTHYGNEWIDYNNTYWKVTVQEDNVYKITVAELRSAGVPVDQTPMNQIQMHHFGVSHPIYTSTNGIGQDDDYIMWYGKKNRSELDKFIYEEGEKLFNPEVSLINDKAAYFISISESINSQKINITDVNLTGNTLLAEPYYIHKETKAYSDRFYKPVINASHLQYSNMVGSEGFGSALTGNNTDISLPISNHYSAGPDAELFITLGGNRTFHKTDIYIQNDLHETINNVLSLNESTRTEHVYLTVNNTQLTSDKLDIRIESNHSEDDKHRVGTVELSYPRSFSYMTGGLAMNLPSSNSLRYIEISDYTGAEDLFVLDIENNESYKTQKIGNKHGAILPASSSDTPLIVYTSDDIISIQNLEEKSYTDFGALDHDYIILTNSELENEGTDYVNQYAAFRASDLGNNYNPIVIDISELYDQFGYGVDRHFISIRNFGHFVDKEWTRVKNMFIIGHSLEYSLYRTESQIIQNQDFFYVPTFGTPGSDGLLLSTQGSNVPKFAVGRLAARSADDIKGYLEKAIAFAESRKNPQTIEDKLWLKNVLHLSGGTTDIQDLIANNLNVMKDTIEKSNFGANVSTFFKKSSSTVEIALSDQIFNRINEGTSIITFFGHASVGTFDFSLDDVENYENEDKYPLLLSLGCYSGNIHTNANISISKDFVLTPKKGSIGFLAASGTAYITQQYNFARDFYHKIGNDFYGRTIGDALIKVIDEHSLSTSINVNTFLQQLNLHGDPAIVLLNYQAPDLVCDENTAMINPRIVDTYLDEFEFCFDLVNLGKGRKDSVDLQITHLNPSGEIETDSIIRVSIPNYKSQVCTILPIKNRMLLGENTIKVKIDPQSDLTESPFPDAENNNDLIINGEEGFKFFVLSNSAVPTYPKEFSIVNTQELNLVSSTYNAFDDPQLFHVQIDTTEEFNSPVLQSFDVLDAQGTFSQKVTLMPETETVYYWRVSQDSTSSSIGPVWNKSSFVYVAGEGPGWNQSHYYQYLSDDFENVEFRNRKLKYLDNVKDIRFALNHSLYRNSFFINEGLWDVWDAGIGGTSGVSVVVFDPIKGNPWLKPAGSNIHGSETALRGTHYYNYKADTENSRNDLANFLTNVIPDGYSVVLSFRGQYAINDWYSEINEEGSFFNILEQEGASSLDNLADLGSRPYLFGYVKGIENTRVIVEETDEDPNIGEGINSSFQITVLWDRGSITSPLIGPSTGYTKLEWGVKNIDYTESDTISIDIIGVDQQNNETVLIEGITDFDYNLTGIDHQNYPYLKLRWNTKDEENFTTTQIEKLRVIYRGVPDIALDVTGVMKKTYDQGQTISLDIDLKNITSLDMADFKSTYKVTNSQNQTSVYTHDIPAINAGESYTDVVTIESTDLTGKYSLEYIANPQKNPTESYYHNNFALTSLDVNSDHIAPVLDVTFDGIQILDNDIVSAKPLINISLKDENEFLLVNDTSLFTVLLESPNGEIQQIDMNSPDIIFYPATEGSVNKARLEFNPHLTTDGTYKLTVNAMDVSQNVAGQSSYEVSFRVFNEEMVSNVFNYPNPFSTSTQFVFTLTGDEEPGNLLIRIMTVTGKVVKEITMAELGNVRVGVNKTEYKWDGTDEYGSKLGNGVYFYQVITKKIDGSDYQKFTDPTTNNTDHMFKKGFGKMVIMR